MDNVTGLLRFLRGEVRLAVAAYCKTATPEEIRLRKNLPLSVTLSGKNMYLTREGRPTLQGGRLICAAEDMQFAARALSEGSIYRCMPTICEGYIITEDGLRVGVCGRCVYTEKKLTAVEDFTSFNIRIPHNVIGCADVLSRKLLNSLSSVLIFSPPGAGKTTFVRDLALSLSRQYRIAVCDEKCEIFPSGSDFEAGAGMLDILSGYRKADGIEIATRTLSPEIIICDEIGAADDVNAILSMQNSGVCLAATVHAADFDDLMRKPNIEKLINARVISVLAGLGLNAAHTVELKPAL